MKKIEMNESTKYYVDLTISKYLGSQNDSQSKVSNIRNQKQSPMPKVHKSNTKCNNMS